MMWHGSFTRRCKCCLQNKLRSVVVLIVCVWSLDRLCRSETFYKIKVRYNHLYRGYYYGVDEDVTSWMKKTHTECGGNFTGYGQRFALLRNVTLREKDPKFYIHCNLKGFNGVKYFFDYGSDGTHINNWLQNVVAMESSHPHVLANDKQVDGVDSKLELKRLVILVQRYEFANVFHTMTDWYNVFLVAKLLGVRMEHVTVLLNGKNIHGPLDYIWESLFGTVAYTDEISREVVIPALAWNIQGYESPMSYLGRQKLPYVKEFKDFVYTRHNLVTMKVLDCDKLTIVMLLRRDYVTHAGNTEGKVSRKIKNEFELLESLREQYPRADIQGVQFDRLTFKEQLELVSRVDILIGMHGAGLTHVLFLPSHAGLIELYPLYWTKGVRNMYFESMTRWRKLKYLYWQNVKPEYEHPDQFTYVPSSVLIQTVRTMHTLMCS